MLNITIFNLTNQILTSKNYLESEIKASKKVCMRNFVRFSTLCAVTLCN